MFYYKSNKRQIVGSSPEMLVRVDNRKVITFPIAGTTPLTDDKQENQPLAKALRKDQKSVPNTLCWLI